MPNYKKKKHSRFLNQPAKASKNRMQKKQKNEDIEMTPKSKSRNSDIEEMKVIKGNKYRRERKSRVGLCVLAVVLVLVVCLQIILPGGIINTVTNAVALLGTGSYPIELGNASIVDSVSKGSYKYVLSIERSTSYSIAG